MVSEAYPTTERLIHEYLDEFGENFLKEVRRIWKEDRKVDPFLILVPETFARTDDNFAVMNAVTVELKEIAREDWKRTLKEGMDRIGGYAFLLLDVQSDRLRILVESPLGATTWTVPIKQQGEVRVLKTAEKERGKGMDVLIPG